MSCRKLKRGLLVINKFVQSDVASILVHSNVGE